jgi:hypothetical protein
MTIPSRVAIDDFCACKKPRINKKLACARPLAAWLIGRRVDLTLAAEYVTFSRGT